MKSSLPHIWHQGLLNPGSYIMQFVSQPVKHIEAEWRTNGILFQRFHSRNSVLKRRHRINDLHVLNDVENMKR